MVNVPVNQKVLIRDSRRSRFATSLGSSSRRTREKREPLSLCLSGSLELEQFVNDHPRHAQREHIVHLYVAEPRSGLLAEIFSAREIPVGEPGNWSDSPMTRVLRTIARRESQCDTLASASYQRGSVPSSRSPRAVAQTLDFPRGTSFSCVTRDHRYIFRRKKGRTMVQQANGEVETGNVEESSRYFSYLRTLADLTAIASIMAVQVIAKFHFGSIAV